mgnify:FL=1
MWYNVIVKKQNPQEHYTAYQLKLPVEIEIIIEISDPVYSFSEVMDHIDLNKYLTIEERRTGRPRYDQKTLLKIILFAFMENGYASVREIEKYCKTDIRYMWLLQDNPPPSHMTIDNFMNKTMLENIDRIFADVNEYIFQKEQVDLNHVYIDGTKISANAGKYSWVWKKSCEKNRIKLFAKITELLENMNAGTALLCVKFDIREEYAIEYLEEILKKYIKLVGFDPGKAVHGKGNHKTSEQRLIEKLSEYIERLNKYAERIKICGNDRNSYSKTDHDATFMRMKRDHMGNDQLLPGYNIQCEDCSCCPHKEKCCKCKGNRIVRLNEELTQFHAEVLNNLNSIHGALLRMNRSIQSEGTFGTIKWNRSYIRARRRGIKSLFLEFGMISCGFNLHKFHLKKVALRSAA